MIDFIAVIFALAFGFGLACWICGNMLDKSNNIGDSRGTGKTYNAEVTFTSECNNMDRSASKAYYNANIEKKENLKAPSDDTPVKRMTEEERRQNAPKIKKSKIPRGAFVSKNTSGYQTGTDTIPDW